MILFIVKCNAKGVQQHDNSKLVWFLTELPKDIGQFLLEQMKEPETDYRFIPLRWIKF